MMTSLLQSSVKKAAEIIKKHDYARVISHYDADGITSAAIISMALIRIGIPFHSTIVGRLDRSFIQELNEELIIICDMGTAQTDLIAAYLKDKDVIIIDHHVAPVNLAPISGAAIININPHCTTMDGDNELYGEVCAAGLSYLIARCLVADGGSNTDLAGLAIAGTLGDKLMIDQGLNKMILDEAIKEGVIAIKTGLRLGGGNIRELLLYSTDPYIPFGGKVEWVDAFLDKVGIDGDKSMSDLVDEEERRLTTALLAHARESGVELHEDALVGTTYNMNVEVVRNGLDFMRMIDACGRFGKAGIGIGLCMRETKLIEEARSLYRQLQSKLVSELNRIEVATEDEGIQELPHILYFYVQETGITGVLAGILAEYRHTNKPLIVFNQKNGVGEEADTKVSARCNKKLLTPSDGADGGVDLAKALEKAAKEVGGFGGGHPVAAGAAIPRGSEKKFIARIDRIIGEQRRRLV
ncbi:MAG: DHH family phosphoesterase [Halobacteriota archaeon]